MKNRDKVYAILLLLIFIFSLITNWYRILSFSLVVLIVVMIMDKMGKGIVLRELIALHITFVYLLMPILGYDVYNEYNQLAKTWFRYMSVPESEYFGYVLPANAGFILVLCWPMWKNGVSDKGESWNP
jgi:signal transduction histidine kinase